MPDADGKEMQPIRRSVPNDNSCLFYAIAYVAEGEAASNAVQQRLRGVVAAAVLADDDPETRGLMLGKSVEEYAGWIKNEFHWGGENEIVELSASYGCRLAIISAESLSVMTYGEGGKVGYILYTGSHYDPLVAAPSVDAAASEETRLFASRDEDLESGFIELARTHNVMVALKASQKRVKRIKCVGCGAIVDDFQAHCGEVEHDDSFAYECEEVELVIEADEALPEGAIDLTDEVKYFTFFNSSMSEFSNFYAAAITSPNGVIYPSGEHWWQSTKYLNTVPELAAKIQAASTVDDAHTLSHTEGHERHRHDWDEVKFEILIDILRAKFAQHKSLADALVATKGREIVNVDSDQWAGMQAPGGIATGNNNLGKALMMVRVELLASK